MASGAPLLVVLNHPSWWDPLIGVVLADLFPERTHYVPMDARALARYPGFDRLGFYGLEPGTVSGATAFLRTTLAILDRPNKAVWLTAQGRFVDARVRPPGLRAGVGHVAGRLDRGVILPLALEYTFWDDRLPEALARFGEPLRVEANRGLRPFEWVARVGACLSAAQDALRTDALRRDPDAFETLLAGRAAIGGPYDAWRRFRAWRKGRHFVAEHGTAGRRL